MILKLRHRYTLVMLSLVLAISLILAGALIYQSSQAQKRLSEAGLDAMESGLEAYTELRGRQIVHLLSAALANDLYLLNMQHIYELLQTGLQTPGVLGIIVFDHEGRVVHDGREDIPGFNEPLGEPQALQVLEPESGIVVWRTAEQLHVVAPVRFGDMPLGGILVTLSLADMLETLRSMDQRMETMENDSLHQNLLVGLTVTLFLVLMGVVISMLIGHRLVRPIQALALHAKEIGAGRYGDILNSHRGDEIGDLVRAFNAMSQNLQQTQSDLIAAKDDAEAASKAKSQFLAMISHEIRSPMNGVLGMLDLLLHTPLEPQQKHQAESAYHAAESLLHLINDVLDFSKIEAHGLQLEHKVFDLAGLLEEVVNLFSARVEAQGLYLRLERNPGFPSWVRGDPLRLRQVLVNLISNAVKFTARGGVRVHVAHAMPDEGKILLSVSVQDTGIGIEEEDKTRIFEAFVQADGSSTRQYGGTGLGLAITKELVALMGGRLRLESGKGKGSTFIFDALLQPAEAPGVELESWQIPSQSFSGTVLICEDNPVNQELAQEMLFSFGCEVIAAGHGQEALKLLESNAVDLVFMDCQMPVMDGFEATQAIRKGERHNGKPHLPIVAFTAHALDGDREACLACGMDDYLSKPFTRQDLSAMLKRWLPASQCDHVELAAENPLEPNPSVESGVGLPQETLLDESVLDSMQLPPDRLVVVKQRLYSTCLADAPKHFANLESAFDSGDLETVHREAHYLKSSTTSLGARELALVFRGIEVTAKEGVSIQLEVLLVNARVQFDQILSVLRSKVDSAG